MSRVVLPFAMFAALAACADYATPSVALYEAGDYQGAAREADAGLTAHPGDGGLWGMRVRSAIALGDAAGAAAAYGSYVAHRGGDDAALLHGLALATIQQALHSTSSKLRVEAIETIERERLMPFVDDVMAAMSDNDDRIAAAAAVALLHDTFKAPDILDEMLHSESAEARRIAIAGLARKAGRIAEVPVEQAASDRDPRVRAVAVAAIGQIGDTDGIALLAKRLGDPDEGVRVAAASSLAKLGKGDLRAFAKRALADEALAVRVLGADLLGAAGDTGALVQLAGDPDPILALEAAVALTRPAHSGPALRAPEGLAADVAKRALASQRWEARSGAVNALAQLVGAEAARALAQPLASDPDPRVRLAAARALAAAGDRDTAVRVDRAELTGAHAAEAAADLAALDGDPAALDALAKLAADRSHTADQRMAAVTAHLAAHRITPGLVAALADPNALVRIAAASALAALAK